MADSVNIDWGLLKPADPVGAYVGGLQAGRALGQQGATIAALHNLDPANPSPTINALLRVGDIPGATGVANLGFIQAQRNRLMQGYDELQGVNGAQGATPQAQPPAVAAPAVAAPAPAMVAPNGAPSTGGAQTDPTLAGAGDLTPDQRAQALARADTFDQLGVELSGLPYAQRQARIQAEAPALIAHGLPAAQISSFDPTDENIAAIHNQIAQVRGVLGGASVGPATQATAPAATGAMAVPLASAPASAPTPAGAPATPQASPDGPATGGAPADSAAPPAPSNGAQGSPYNLHNPNFVKAVLDIGMGGGDITGLLAAAKANTPTFSTGRAGSMAFNDVTGQWTGSSNPDNGTYDVPDGHGGFVNVAEAGAATNAALYKGGIAGGEAAAQAGVKVATAGPIAQAEAAGEGAGKAPYTPIEVNMPDGSRVTMTLDQFKMLKGSGLMPTLGEGQSTQAKEFAEGDTAAFNKTLSTVANPQAMMQQQNARDIVLQTLHTVQGLNPNAFTADKYGAARLLSAAGFKPTQDFTNDVATYSGLLPQVLRGTFSTFPRLEKEFEVVKAGMANITTPRDAASVLLATQAALHDRNLAYAQYASDWKGAPSQRAIDQSFNNSPAGQTSLFADPVWKNMTINGKPATMVGTAPIPAGQPGAGHVWGVFRPGTPFAQPFMVR